MVLSGDSPSIKKILHKLTEWSVSEEQSGKPCIAEIGPRGSAHYVKMIHDGIEQGMLGVLNEAWEMLFKCLHTPLDDLSGIFKTWSADGELVSTHSKPHFPRLTAKTAKEKQLPRRNRRQHLRAKEGGRPWPQAQRGPGQGCAGCRRL